MKNINKSINEEQSLISVKSKNELTFFIFWITLASAIGGFLFGYDTGIISGTLLFIKDYFQLNNFWQELLVSITILGAWIFSIVAGHFSDFWGRWPVIIISSVIFAFASFLMAFSWNIYALLAGRFIVGASIGLSSMTTPIYIAELAPFHIREKLVILFNIFLTGGQFIAAVFSGIFASNEQFGWRWMLGFPAVPAIIQFLTLFFMPESHRWLIKKGRYSDAIEVLRKIRSSGVQEEFEKIRDSCLEQEKEKVEKGAVSFFKNLYQNTGLQKALFIGCALQLIQQLSGINTVMYYSATIIKMSGIHSIKKAVWWSVATSGINFVGTLIGLVLVGKIGPRLLVLTSLVGVIFSLMVLAVGFQLSDSEFNPVTFQDSSTNRTRCYTAMSCQNCIQSASCGFCYSSFQNKSTCLVVQETNHSRSKDGFCKGGTKDEIIWAFEYCPSSKWWIIVVGLGLYLLTFSPGMGPMPWTINSEIFPLWARSVCFSISTSINWISNLLVSLTFLTLIQTFNKHGTFWLYVGFATIGWILFLFLLPDTKGKSLEEIEILFKSSSFKINKKNKSRYTRLSGVNQSQNSENSAND